jgi:proteic killer suppression protein
MIHSYADKHTEQLANHERVKCFQHIERTALRKLYLIDAATELSDLTVPPGNKLESLSGDRLGQYSIRINSQYRICFNWADGGAYNVEIVDYH